MNCRDKQKISLMCIVIFIFLTTSCAQAVTAVSPTETQTLEATATPTAKVIASATFIATPTATFSPLPIGTASPYPTIEFPITPNLAQVEQWQEYQSALAKELIPFVPPEEVLCEWDLMGHANQEVYVWAVCQGPLPGAVKDFTSISTPAVIHLGEGNFVQSVEFPNARAYSNGDILRMFPPDVRKKFKYYDFGMAERMSEHIEWRREHPDEPPLIVLSATPTP